MLVNFIKYLLPITLILLSSNLSAKDKETSFSYAGIYKSLKTSRESDFSQLVLHFLLLENISRQRCPTDKIMLSDGKSKKEVLVNDEGALLLPLNKSFKTDHAAITFTTNNNINCYLTMQISVAEFELDNFKKSTMMSWLKQFENIYETLAGWPGKYFMPSVNGIAIHTKNKSIDVVVDNEVALKLLSDNGVLLLSSDKLNNLPDGSELIFNGIVKKVLPTLEK